MPELACIGDTETLLIYRALGIPAYPARTPAEAAALLRRLAAGPVAVVFLTEPLAAGLESLLQAYQEAASPAVILIPAASGTTGLALEAVRRRVEQAAGMNLL